MFIPCPTRGPETREMNNGTGWSNKRGFTLVEISIGLVIIGLLIAGIVTGKSMIEAAELRGLLSQIDKIDTAVNSFKTKYNCLPGDCLVATNFFPSGGCPNGNSDPTTTCNGDGGGYINHNSGTSNTPQRREHFKFWQHLAMAGLIEGQYSGIGGADSFDRHAIIGTNVPATPISGLGISIYHHLPTSTSWSVVNGEDRGVGTHIIHIGAERPAQITSMGKLTVAQSRSVDEKIDNGLAISGKVGVYVGTASLNTQDCTTGASSSYVYSSDQEALCLLLMFRNW